MNEILYTEGDLRFAVATAKSEIDRLTKALEFWKNGHIEMTAELFAVKRAQDTAVDEYIKCEEKVIALTAERDALRADAERYRKLCAILQKAYDTDSFESERLTIYCEQLSGWRNERTVEATLRWLDARDAGLDLSSAIDAAIAGEKK